MACQYPSDTIDRVEGDLQTMSGVRFNASAHMPQHGERADDESAEPQGRQSPPSNVARAHRGERARADLYDTLGQLRVRLDYAQRIDDGVARAKQRIAAEKRENPLVFGAAVVGVAAVCGVRRMGDRFEGCAGVSVA